MSSKHLIRVPSAALADRRGRTLTQNPPARASAVAAGSEIPPLHWWRRLPADIFTGSHLTIIRRAISGFDFIGERYWPAAVKGEPAAAIAVALWTIKRRRRPSPGLDLIMSALLRCAIEGNATAILVLAHVLDRMAAKDRSCVAPAASWRLVKVAGQARRRLKSA